MYRKKITTPQITDKPCIIPERCVLYKHKYF